MSEIYNKNEFHRVSGEIYKITNTVNNKCYIGQTRSHHLNNGKYRPFGYLGRFNCHISEAYRNKQHSVYLDASIRKYGHDKFVCERILECSINELDQYEQHYISEFNSKYPNGYNLTNGGQGKGYMKGEKLTFHEPNPKPPNWERKPLTRSEHTKKLISERLKIAKQDISHRECQMRLTQNQHYKKKFDLYKDVTVDGSNLEQYIHVIRNNKKNYDYVRVKIQGIRIHFTGKYETISDTQKRALQFIKELIIWQHDQIAGTSLEPSPTTPLLETTDGGTRVMTETNGKNGEGLGNPQPSPYVRYDKDTGKVQRLDDCGSEGTNHPP
jgi:group I intron endonuclease